MPLRFTVYTPLCTENLDYENIYFFLVKLAVFQNCSFYPVSYVIIRFSLIRYEFERLKPLVTNLCCSIGNLPVICQYQQTKASTE